MHRSWKFLLLGALILSRSAVRPVIVTVLAPEADARQFSYDRRTHRLEPLSSVDAEAARDALAHVLMPAWLYREQRYRMRTNPSH